MNFFDQDNQHVGMQVNADQITITMLMSGEFLRELRRWITLMQDQGLPDDEQYQGLPDDEQYEEVLEALYLPTFCANGQKAGVIGRVVVVEQERQ